MDQTEKLFDIVCAALPEDLEAGELLEWGKPEWWQTRMRLAIAYSLRKCPRINWLAYLKDYPDVAAAGTDPVLHFLKYGLYEGRRLKSWPKGHVRSHKTRPLISVVLYADNRLYLEKSLNSLTFQTLSSIEIIIIGNNAKDSRLEIARNFADRDPRIRIIICDDIGVHMARKAGVMAAAGEYLIFLDSDSFLTQDACATAYDIIAHGHDMAVFEICPNRGAQHAGTDTTSAQWYKLPDGIYTGNAMILKMVNSSLAQHIISGCIFSADLAKMAFAEMKNWDFDAEAGFYEVIVLAGKSRSIIKSGKCLAVRMCGVLTGQEDWDIKIAFSLPAVLKQYFIKNSLPGPWHKLKEHLLLKGICRINGLQPELFTCYLRQLFNCFGTMAVLGEIVEQAPVISECLVEHIAAIPDQRKKCNNPSRIGIIYYDVMAGGIQRTIQNLCRIMIKRGYQITLILQRKTDDDLPIDKSVSIDYISPSGRDRMEDLRDALTSHPIDIILYMDARSPTLVYDLLLLKLAGIPVISSLRNNYNHDFLACNKNRNYSTWLKTLRCLDKLICLSTTAQIYLRSQNIDAEYVPNPVPTFKAQVPQQKNENIIGFIGAVWNTFKNIGACLDILKKVLMRCPDAKLLFIGSIKNKKLEAKFNEKIKKLGVQKNIEITGFVQNPQPYLDKCKLLVATSFMEGFPNGVAEAQSRGLPIVMYDIDIMMAKNNSSIIRIKQGDVDAAANHIIDLLLNEAYRLRLADAAILKAAEYSDEHFAHNIIELIKNYYKYSKIQQFSCRDYRETLKYMMFYAGQDMPPA